MSEPTVRSWPLPVFRHDDAPWWHVAGTNPPQYAPDARLEALWRAGQKPRTVRVLQLSFLEVAA